MITLQNFLFPDPAICTERELYFHAEGEIGFSQTAGTLWVGQAGVIRLDTYFNLFNIGKWHRACRLDGLFAEFHGKGRVEIRVFQAIPEQSWEVLFCEVVTLEEGQPCIADLTHYADRSTKGLIFVEIKALDETGATLTGGRFATAQTSLPAPLPRLAVSITTFKREKQVRLTVARLEAFLKTFEYRDQVHVQVVDNGQSAQIQASDQVTPIDNANYGGAGGFARGLLEAENSGFTHCLFMDDDASFHMENIARTYMFLALARDRRAAVAGAMINNTHKWAMWENGAWFDRSCHPIHGGTDLRSPEAVFRMEYESTGKQRPTFYGGWWFFAFAIDQVTHHPFPFFVRGDDISFSLMNDFDISLLNGVVSFQDDFIEKENPQTLYLDVRSHVVHHFVSNELIRSPLATALVPIRRVMRSLLRLHYETARAELLAWQDAMKGPQFFDDNIDMAARRAAIKEMIKHEVWEEINPQVLSEKRRLTLKSRRWRERLGKYTLNGHLMPFSARRWDRIVLGINERSPVYPSLCAAEITFLNTDRDKGYTVRQSKREFFSIGWDMTKTLWRFLRDYDQIKSAYRDGYEELTAKDYWQKKLV